MNCSFKILLLGFLATGCNAGLPRADIAYRGNGDARIVEFMRGNYMSSAAGVAKVLERHLQEGLPPGHAMDRAYLVQRGAACTDGPPAVCTFSGIADERFSGMPEENAARAHRITRIEARVVLRDTAQVEVTKEESYPDAEAP